MTLRTFRRAGGPGRRTPRIRRASAGLTPVRAGAALAMLLSAMAVYGLAATSAFGFSKLQIEGSTITSEATIRDSLALTEGENLFDMATEPLVARLREIPAIAGATISIGLPDTVAVRVEERQPILVWRIEDRRLLVDRSGLLFARVSGTSPASVAELPVIVDTRAASRKLIVGRTVDAIDLDAATRLASITPGAIGSSASGLAVGVTDANGFVVSSVPESWEAIFGFYGRSLRTPDIIPGQALVLQTLLLGREPTVAQVILGDDLNGTYIPKASPRPSATPKP